MATKTQMSDQEYQQKFAEKLGDSIGRAQWIQSPADKPDHDGQTLVTRNHEVIQHWAQERKAQPATIAGTEHKGRPGVLRFDFPGYETAGGELQVIDWDRWFETFDARDLVMLFQEKKSDGNQSNFFRFASPHREDA
jgi:hypothetical protein